MVGNPQLVWFFYKKFGSCFQDLGFVVYCISFIEILFTSSLLVRSSIFSIYSPSLSTRGYWNTSSS